VRDFLLDRQARALSVRTVAWYSEQLAHLCRYATSRALPDVSALTAPVLRELLITHAQTHNPGGTHALYRALSAFLTWHAREYDLPNPMVKVHPPRVPERTLEPVSLDGLKAMLAVCERRTFTGDRDAAILLCLLDSGCRRAEFLALDVSDVNLESGGVLVKHGKGDKPRMTFLGAKSRRALAGYLKHRRGSTDAEPLWVDEHGKRLSATALRAVLVRRAKQAGVPAATPHAFRRGFAINALRAGCDLVSLQRLLGHADLSVLNRYLRQTEADLQAAHAKASPVDGVL
jgi:site-specific recombinase XerD